MARTFVRQDTQIRNSTTYLDNIAPTLADYETNPLTIEDDLNNIRSQINNFLNRDGSTFPTQNWWDPIATPSGFELASPRGINKLNTELHNLERKRVLTQFVSLADVLVSGGTNFTVLAFAELPAPNILNPYLIASGSSSILTGTVAASGSMYQHSLNEVPGATAISPKNLCTIVTGSTRDPILSEGRTVYGLFQTDKLDGQTLVGGDAQISFVRLNVTGDDLEAVPVSHIENKVINYTSVTRKALEDLSEQDFLRGAEIDVPSAQSGVTRQNGYDNQGTTPVDLLTDATLDLEANGITWAVRDNNEANLFRIIEGSTGGTTQVSIDSDVDTFNVDAQVNDFDQGIRVDSGGQRINIGETAGLIESTSTNDLRVLGAGELYLDDGNQPVSWTQTNGIKLSDAAVEWSEFETAFDGEVSLLKAISDSRRRDKVYATVNTTVTADNDVSLTAGNIDVTLPYMNSGSFLYDYDVYLNGELLRPGAADGAGNDYYPGSDAYALKFEFSVRLGDVICVVPYVRF